MSEQLLSPVLESWQQWRYVDRLGDRGYLLIGEERIDNYVGQNLSYDRVVRQVMNTL